MSDIFVLSTDAYNAAVADAEARYPEESCGFILEDGSFLPLENVSANKHQSFVIAMKDWDDHKGRVQAVVHSHPNGGGASQIDLHAQFSIGLPFIILRLDSGKISKVETVG